LFIYCLNTINFTRSWFPFLVTTREPVTQNILYYRILADGSKDFNKLLKYTLLINNFTIVSTIFGQLIAIYIGCGLIGNDIISGKLYIMITSFPKRWKYLLGNFIGLFLVVVTFVLLILLNYFVATFALDIYVNISDLVYCFASILLNMFVIMTLTAVSSIFIHGKTSLVVGLIGMVLFNIYTYQYIPFVNTPVLFDMKIRRALACLVPVSNVAAPSIYSDGSLDKYIVKPFLINNMYIYQVVFVIIVLIFGIAAFKHKEL
jgi:ABC-type transport system involved in multi-copper enzyme maturation permease subunit